MVESPKNTVLVATVNGFCEHWAFHSLVPQRD
jgi:hypothetical protein